MFAEVQTVPTSQVVVGHRRWWKSREFLLVSVGLHLLFGIGCGYHDRCFLFNVHPDWRCRRREVIEERKSPKFSDGAGRGDPARAKSRPEYSVRYCPMGG